MATGGEVQGQVPDRFGSEDLDQLKCQPCLEDGNFNESVGICVTCQDYLCQRCFEIHKLPKPCRNHQLLDREQMLQGQIRTSPKDVCTEKCSIHDDKVIEYYCTNHCLLGCTVCITLDHALCKGVQYIPHVAKELASNEEYRKVEIQLKSALEAFKKVSENAKQNAEGLESSCTEALESIKETRKRIDESLNKIAADLAEKVQAMKSKEIKELAMLTDKYKKAQEELQSALAKKQALQSANQNCSTYTEMMKTKEKLKSLEAQIKEAKMDKSCRKTQIQFSPNLETIEMLKQSTAFGILAGSGTGTILNPCTRSIVSAKHVQDINVKPRTDTATCLVTGLAVLPDSSLVLVDCSNKKIKAVDVQNGEVFAQLNVSSKPWDIAIISKNKVAMTLPDANKVAFVTVGRKNLNIDRYLNVNGYCYGVDCRNDKLAVSFLRQDKVQILNLQGSVLYNISTDKLGHALFSSAHYLTYGQDGTTLYVSNFSGNNVVCVKMDGTVVATFTDSGLKGPLKPVVDSSGDVLVCADNSHTVHQITKDSSTIKVLLTKADGVCSPFAVCLSEEKDKLYVGMYGNDNVKVYTIERRSQ